MLEKLYLVSLMRNSIKLVCSKCKKEYPFNPKLARCKVCNEPLEIIYDYESLSARIKRHVFENRVQNIWRYIDLFPIKEDRNIISLHEGFTPLLKAEKLGKELGVYNLYLKDETRNPTFSFKDRGSAVGVSVAKEFDFNAVICASTGNMAASLSAYAAKAGINALILIPGGVSEEKIAQISIYEPMIFEVGRPYPELYRMVFRIIEKYDIVPIHSDSPLRIEGQKTIAFEILEQLDWKVPDWIIVPTSSGGNLSAIWKGFVEFHTLELIDELPKIIAVQSDGCAPIVKAFKEKKESVEPWGEPKTIAHSISNPNPALASGNRVLRILRECGGYAEAVSDKKILDAIRLISSKEGIFAEPASATSVAVIDTLLNENVIDRTDYIVSILTGSGLKEIKSIKNVARKPIKVKSLEEIIEKWIHT